MAKSKEVEIEIKVETKSITDLKKELKDLKSEMLNATDPKDILRLASAAGEVQDKLADVNEQIKQFASGSNFEQSANSLKAVGDGLLKLDFGKAQERAQAFAKSAGSISFGQAITSVKQFGQTMATIGKALLTNPLFLIGAVVAVIVVAIYEFLDSIGLVKKALDLLMLPLDILIDGLKQLAELFGINTKSAEEFADENKKATDKIVSDNERRINAIQFEIDKRRAAGEDTFVLERQKLAAIRETAEAQIELNKQLLTNLILTGQKDSEQYKTALDAIKENLKVKIKANQDITISAISENKKITDGEAKELEKRKSAQEKADAEKDKRLRDEFKLRQELFKELRDLELDSQIDSRKKFEEIEAAKWDDKIRIAQEKYPNITAIITALEVAKEEAVKKVGDDYQKKKDDEAEAKRITDAQKKLENATIENETDIERLKLQGTTKTQIEDEEFAQRKDILDQRLADGLVTQEQYNLETLKLQNETSDAIEARKAIEAENIKNLAANALGAIAANMEEGSNAAKALAAAQIIFDTYRGAQAAYASALANPISIMSGTAYAAINAGIAVAFGIANLRKLMSTKSPKAGQKPSGSISKPSGGGSSAPSAQKQTQATPQFNLIGQGNNQNTVGAGGTAPNVNIQTEVTVSETAMTNTQNRVKRLSSAGEL